MAEAFKFPILMVNPIVNINGDTQHTLVGNHTKAMNAVRAAIDAMKECAPHGRNYPKAESFPLAREGYEIRLQALYEIYNDLYSVAIAIDTQKKE